VHAHHPAAMNAGSAQQIVVQSYRFGATCHTPDTSDTSFDQPPLPRAGDRDGPGHGHEAALLHPVTLQHRAPAGHLHQGSQLRPGIRVGASVCASQYACCRYMLYPCNLQVPCVKVCNTFDCCSYGVDASEPWPR
jgi:hypothetical protein